MAIEPKRMQGAMKAYSEEVVRTFREHIGFVDFPLQTFAVFLYIPSTGQVSMGELVRQFKEMGQTSVGRSVDILCGTSRIKENRGYILAERFEDTMDRRVKIIKLSEEGKQLRAAMHQRGMDIYNRILGVTE